MTEKFSPWHLEQVAAILSAARNRHIEDDPELAKDEGMLMDILSSDPQTCSETDALDQALRAIVYCERMEQACDKWADDYRARRDRWKKRADNWRAAAYGVLHILGISVRSLPDLSASVGEREGAVEVFDERQLPPIYVRTTTEPDKAKIRSSLLGGVDVPGARLGDRQPFLRIKAR